MAYSVREENSFVPWQSMRIKWIRYTEENAPAKELEKVKKYFNTFLSKHRYYQFVVAQIFSGLYDVGITVQQYKDIKEELEKIVGLDLPTVADRAFLAGGFKQIRSFRNLQEFIRLQQDELLEKNRPIVAKKYQEAKMHYELLMKRVFRQQNDKIIMSLDVEVYEHNRDKILEIGYIVVRFSSSTERRRDLPAIEVTCKRHFIIKENLHYKNKDFVPDNRDGFVFGFSETVSQKEAVKMFRIDVTQSSFLLGHSVQHDDEYLKKIGVDLSSKTMWDTQLIEMHKEIKPNDKCFFTRGLSTLVAKYEVLYEEKDLHNAGCDACYTMLVFLRQMGYCKNTVNRLLQRY